MDHAGHPRPTGGLEAMRISMMALPIVLALSAFAAGSITDRASAQNEAAGEHGKLEQIIPGYYAYSSGARLSGVIATDAGVVVIDSLSSEAMAKHERALIASATGKPIRYLISSTFHGNYALGNVAYPDAVKIGH